MNAHLTARMSSLIAVALSLSGITAQAAITLNFSSLPSTQGWTYQAIGSDSGFAEGAIFTISNSVLTMNSLATGFGGSGSTQGVFYSQSGVVNTNDSFKLEWTSRTLANDQDGDNVGGFGFGIETGYEQYFVGFRTNLLRGLNGVSSVDFALDATVFHTYRLEANLGTHTYNLYVDNSLSLSNLAPFTSANPSRLFFGDTSNSANAWGEISQFSFSQPPIPEPSTVAFILLSTPLVVFRLARRHRK